MPPAPPHGVLITITPPADGSCGTGKPACAYAIYKAVTTSGVCPASGDVSFGVIVASQTALTYTDNASAATTTCYGAETLQSGSHSGPSNIIGPYTIAPNITAPGAGGQTAENTPPILKPMPQPTVAENHAPKIAAAKY